MTTLIKYLAFKGIEKKEQILFKSFLNLAKNELEYQIVILKEDHDDEPDILIADEDYVFEDAEQHFQSLPTIMVGEDEANKNNTYILRPIQWSEFKLTLSHLKVDTSDDSEVERVLPGEVQFNIDEDTESSLQVDADSTTYADAAAYEYDLGKMSVDYESFTDSEYEHVVDDVRKFNQQDEELAPTEAVVLIKDEEVSVDSSLLVFETDPREAWDFTLSETTTVSVVNKTAKVEPTNIDTEVVLEEKAGLALQPDEEYWLANNEIIVDHQTLFYIKTERDMIYSAREPGLWPQLLREGELSKLPLASNWKPINGYNAYPLSCLHWVNTLIHDTEELASDLDPKASYILNEWPQFDLIELDNSLLKLCTMLFIRAETIDSLMAKSGYGRSTVVGLINACHSIGLIKTATEFDHQQTNHARSSEGIFDKIKEVFR